ASSCREDALVGSYHAVPQPHGCSDSRRLRHAFEPWRAGRHSTLTHHGQRNARRECEALSVPEALLPCRKEPSGKLHSSKQLWRNSPTYRRIPATYAAAAAPGDIG